MKYTYITPEKAQEIVHAYNEIDGAWEMLKPYEKAVSVYMIPRRKGQCAEWASNQDFYTLAYAIVNGIACVIGLSSGGAFDKDGMYTVFYQECADDIIYMMDFRPMGYGNCISYIFVDGKLVEIKPITYAPALII